MAATESTTANYALDTSLSRFTVRAFASGLFSKLGHSPTIAIREFKGEARFVPGTIEKAELRLKIQAASLELTDDVSERDRLELEKNMRDDVLAVTRYPEILFESSSIQAEQKGEGQYTARISGNVTLRGVTRPVSFAAQAQIGGDRLRAYGEFTLSQSAFGIKPVSVAGGALKLKDELKFSFDMVGRKIE